MYSRTRRLDRVPAREDADRHQRGGEDHERQRNAVDAHGIGDGAAEPGPLFDELEVGRSTESNRHTSISEIAERDQRGPQRDPARIALRRLVVPLRKMMKSAPTSGKRMIVERIGQLVHSERRPAEQ